MGQAKMPVNTIRIVVQRGDGECIDVGSPPDFRDPMSISRFLVSLHDAYGRCGTYKAFDGFVWSPENLEFRSDTSSG